VRLLVCVCMLLLAFAPQRARADDIDLREDGVLYFEDTLPSKITATVQAPTTVFLRRDFQRPLAGLDPGAKIELMGMSPEGYLVKGTYQNNTVSGWIRPGDLPPGIDPALLALAKKNQARNDAVADAIAHKSVIRGMTPDEVVQSLGKPEQTSSHTDDSGSSITWIYTTYAIQYQSSFAPGYYGRLQLQTYPVKVPIGQFVVNFVNGGVVSTDEHKTDPDSPGVVTN
jgi:hypothetical protein